LYRRPQREVNAVYTSTIETQKMVLATLDRAKSERATGTNDVLPLLEALSNKIADLGKSVELVLDGGHLGPLLSVALEEWIRIRGGLALDPKKVDTDYNRVKDFITFAGDKPINKYGYLDFQSFANMLAHVPAKYSVKPEFRGMTQAEAMRHNDGLPPAKRHKTLTAKTIESNYLSPLIAATIGLSLIGIVTFGSLAGSMLPFALKRIGFDPASASAPFVATLVDVTGIVIYFSVALVVLRGTLL